MFGCLGERCVHGLRIRCVTPLRASLTFASSINQYIQKHHETKKTLIGWLLPNATEKAKEREYNNIDYDIFNIGMHFGCRIAVDQTAAGYYY